MVAKWDIYRVISKCLRRNIVPRGGRKDFFHSLSPLLVFPGHLLGIKPRYTIFKSLHAVDVGLTTPNPQMTKLFLPFQDDTHCDT